MKTGDLIPGELYEVTSSTYSFTQTEQGPGNHHVLIYHGSLALFLGENWVLQSRPGYFPVDLVKVLSGDLVTWFPAERLRPIPAHRLLNTPESIPSGF